MHLSRLLFLLSFESKASGTYAKSEDLSATQGFPVSIKYQVSRKFGRPRCAPAGDARPCQICPDLTFSARAGMPDAAAVATMRRGDELPTGAELLPLHESFHRQAARTPELLAVARPAPSSAPWSTQRALLTLQVQSRHAIAVLSALKSSL